MGIPLLVTTNIEPEHLARIEAAGFTMHKTADPAVRAVLTNGTTGFTAAQIAELPQLEIICAQGAGFERIDLAAAAARGIPVTHGPGVNDAAVADHAMALLLAAVRNIPISDAAVRRGEWTSARKMRPSINGKNLGILGLGMIGLQIAKRAAAFGTTIAYHNRNSRNDVAYDYMPTAIALAEWSDFLVIATPGGAGTSKLVDAAILSALGPSGFVVNIARGSVVDTDALIDALEHGRIAGAALDVVDGEPIVPPALLRLPNVVFTPHVAGRAPEAVLATIELVLKNLHAHFAGEPVLTPVPE